MLYNVITTYHFEQELKRLIKKYASLKSEYEQLIDTLEENPEIGMPLGNNLYKIRIAIASKRQGKKWWGKGNYLFKNRRRGYIFAFHL
jgi:mRNA-degrading endonuclease RelE of RelBE toxin-antitoxin system